MGATRLYGVKALKRESEGRTTSAVGRIDLLLPTRFGLSAYPIYVARIPAAPFRRGEDVTDWGPDSAVASKRLTPNLFAVATADSRNLSELRAVDDLASEVFSR